MYPFSYWPGNVSEIIFGDLIVLITILCIVNKIIYIFFYINALMLIPAKLIHTKHYAHNMYKCFFQSYIFVKSGSMQIPLFIFLQNSNCKIHWVGFQKLFSFKMGSKSRLLGQLIYWFQFHIVKLSFFSLFFLFRKFHLKSLKHIIIGMK